MAKKITSKTTLSEISGMLRDDGFEALVGREAEIKKAAGNGCLLWNGDRLTTTDASHIDARPVR